MTRIVLLDDHAILRDGIKHLLENEGDLSVVAECERPSQLQPLIERHAPDLLIIDLNMPEGGGFPLLQRIRPAHPALRIIVLSMHENAGFVAKALSYGVDGYITKTVAAEELVRAIRAVTAGGRFLSSDIAQRPDADQPQEPLLSGRELDVLRGLLQGKNPKTIAAELGITDKTLYAHRTSILHKTGARSIPELQERVLMLGLI
ncbi:MAG: response regulator transcription factor [Arenimonas sp.]|nr:response regulator transcription factor [Arenimonas sp.]